MRPLDLLTLVALAAIWGASYLFIRLAVPAFGPMALVGARVVLGGTLLWAFAAATGRPRSLRRYARRLIILGGLNAAFPYVLISAAELQLTASLAALLGASAPLFATVFGSVWLGERFDRIRVMGLASGVVGVGMIVGWSPLPLTLSGLLAVGAMLAASASYAASGIYARQRLAGVPVSSLALGQQLGALAWIGLPALVWSPRTLPPPTALGSALALGILCTAVAYPLYFRLLARVGPTRTSTVTYLIPVFGIAWGGLFLNEPLRGGMAAGFALVLAGVVLVNEVRVPGVTALVQRGRAVLARVPAGRGIAVALVCAAALACRAESEGSAVSPDSELVRLALERSLPAMDGERLSVALVQVTYGPAESSAPHRHGCPVIGYVAEGSLRSRVGNGPPIVYPAGSAFYEGPNENHLVSANASESEPVTFVALFVCDGDAPRSTPLRP